MTREEIITELNHRATQKYLMYLALQEIMLDYYQDVKILKFFDLDLKTKHKNMVNALKRNSSEAYRFLQNYEDGENTIKQFHDFVTLFENLHNAIDQGGKLYSECIDAINETIEKHNEITNRSAEK